MTFAQRFLDDITIDYIEFDFNERYKRRGLKNKYLNKKIAEENLKLFKQIADKYNLKLILAYGTLLGAIREGDFITHDYDIDLMIFKEDIEKLLLKLKLS